MLNLVASKFGPDGIYTNASTRPWMSPEGRSRIVPHDQHAIDAVLHFCNYVYRTYGRFPAHTDAFKTGLPSRPIMWTSASMTSSIRMSRCRKHIGITFPCGTRGILRTRHTWPHCMKRCTHDNSSSVVITGLGIVSPLGCDLGMFWHLLSKGENGIRPISSFDTAPFASSLAGEVRDFDPTDFIPRKQARRMGQVSHFAVDPRSWRCGTPGLSLSRKIVPKPRCASEPRSEGSKKPLRHMIPCCGSNTCIPSP